jgi:transcriptional regulator with XRE-family HTH domain
MTGMANGAHDPISDRIAANRGRQRELYGAPLGDRVRRLTALLHISQARLARTLGLSPAMLSQLVSGRRVKIGDPAVLARLLLLDRRCRALREPPPRMRVDALLSEVSRVTWRWNEESATATPGARPAPVIVDRDRHRSGSPADALRGIAAPARLAAAAAALGPTFPELAEVLRQAAGRPPRPARGPLV